VRLVSRQSRQFYARGELACARYARPIYIFSAGELDDIVEASCDQCRHLGLYRKARIAVRLLPERRQQRPPAGRPRHVHPGPAGDDGSPPG
jgi:hypothetical protein